MGLNNPVFVHNGGKGGRSGIEVTPPPADILFGNSAITNADGTRSVVSEGTDTTAKLDLYSGQGLRFDGTQFIDTGFVPAVNSVTVLWTQEVVVGGTSRYSGNFGTGNSDRFYFGIHSSGAIAGAIGSSFVADSVVHQVGAIVNCFMTLDIATSTLVIGEIGGSSGQVTTVLPTSFGQLSLGDLRNHTLSMAGVLKDVYCIPSLLTTAELDAHLANPEMTLYYDNGELKSAILAQPVIDSMQSGNGFWYPLCDNESRGSVTTELVTNKTKQVINYTPAMRTSRLRVGYQSALYEHGSFGLVTGKSLLNELNWNGNSHSIPDAPITLTGDFCVDLFVELDSSITATFIKLNAGISTISIGSVSGSDALHIALINEVVAQAITDKDAVVSIEKSGGYVVVHVDGVIASASQYVGDVAVAIYGADSALLNGSKTRTGSLSITKQARTSEQRAVSIKAIKTKHIDITRGIGFYSSESDYSKSAGQVINNGRLDSWDSVVNDKQLLSATPTGYVKPVVINGAVSGAEKSMLLSSDFGMVRLDAGTMSVIELPLAAGSAAPYSGFVNTGLDRDGNGLWIIGNDGRGEGAPNVSSVVVLSADFSTVVEEYLIRGVGGLVSSNWFSVQGVAWDSTDNTIWCTDKDGNQIVHIDRATGTLINDAIALPFRPNGMAYDDKRHGLWLAQEGTTDCFLYSCDDGALLDTVQVVATADQLTLDKKSRVLYYSYGGNGASGNMGGVDVETKRPVANGYQDTILHGSEAVEGIYIDGGEMWVCNDGGFHTEATPSRNVVMKYNLNVLAPERKHTSGIGISVAYKNSNPIPGSSRVIIGVAEPFGVGGGWNLYATGDSPHKLRFIASDDGQAATRINVTTVSSLSDVDVINATLFIDSASGTAMCKVNGERVDLVSTDLTVLKNMLELYQVKAFGGSDSSLISVREFFGDIYEIRLFTDGNEFDAIHDKQMSY